MRQEHGPGAGDRCRHGRSAGGVVVVMSYALKKAIFEAAKELERGDWDITGRNKTPRDFGESEFYQVMEAHILPMVNATEIKKARRARIKALRMELSELEAEDDQIA